MGTVRVFFPHLAPRHYMRDAVGSSCSARRDNVAMCDHFVESAVRDEKDPRTASRNEVVKHTRMHLVRTKAQADWSIESSSRGERRRVPAGHVTVLFFLPPSILGVPYSRRAASGWTAGCPARTPPG